MMTRLFSLWTCLFLICSGRLSAQSDSSMPQAPVYRVNYKWEVPVAAAFLGGSYFGFRALDRYAAYDADDIARLHPDQVNSFDRPIALLNPSGFDHAQKQSDLFLNIAVASPAILLLDRRIRQDWKTFISLLAITHTVDNALYFGAVLSTRRARPLTYNPDLPLEEKIGDAKSNSFFSGHVSFSATSTFFAAKLYTDYHQIKGWKRMLFFTGAAIPPALVGYYRMRAGKHFKTDVLVGLLVGAASGIGIPELHRRAAEQQRLSFSPFMVPGYSGFSMSYSLR